jgi:hypothetical protein
MGGSGMLGIGFYSRFSWAQGVLLLCVTDGGPVARRMLVYGIKSPVRLVLLKGAQGAFRLLDHNAE